MNRAAYYLTFCCLVVSFVLGCIAFATGYWFVAEGEGRLFKRLGLWEACFDGFEYTTDYIGKAYYGCWWIFHKEYHYIRQWILPPWFKSVQTLMTFAMVFEIAALVLIPSASGHREDAKRETTVAVLLGLAGGLIAVTVTVFGIMIGEDRTWMPRPDIDEPSWSFGLAVVSGFFAIFGTICMSVHTLMRKWELLPHDDLNISKRSISTLPSRA
jgi:hypothetical protein